MEDRRTAIAIFICIVFVMIYTEVVLSPMTRRTALVPQVATSPVPTQNQIPSSSAVTLPPPVNVAASQLPTKSIEPSPTQIEAAGVTTVASARYEVVITNLGGRLLNFKLKDYKDHAEALEPLDMVKTAEGKPLPLGVWSGGVSDANVVYSLKGSSKTPNTPGSFSIGAEEDLNLTFVGKLANGSDITKSFKFSSKSYLFGLDVNLSQPPPDGTSMWLEWPYYWPQAAEQGSYDPTGFVILDDKGKVKVSRAHDIEPGASPPTPAKWISFANQYFMATLLGSSSNQMAAQERSDNVFISRLSAASTLGSYLIYLGPKDMGELRKVGHELERNVDLGWFGFLAEPLLLLLRSFYTVFKNYGLAIILLTLVIKAVFLPLTRASFKSMKAMQDLQPEMQALRERIKDSTQLNQELMALYKKRGVNPMGGCLPILIQIPVFFGLYTALLNSIELRHAPFALWIKDLSAPERLMVAGIPIPLMVLLWGASIFYQQYTAPAVGDPMQRKMMYAMSGVFVVIFMITPMPSGLVLYWLINNLISITQQQYLKHDSVRGPIKATAVASLVIFGVGWALTLI